MKVEWQLRGEATRVIDEDSKVYLDPSSMETLRQLLRRFREASVVTTLRLPDLHGRTHNALQRLGTPDPHAHISLSSSGITDEDGTKHEYVDVKIFAVVNGRGSAVVRYKLARDVAESDFIGEVGHGVCAAIQVARYKALTQTDSLVRSV